jgi:hypothetical protein
MDWPGIELGPSAVRGRWAINARVMARRLKYKDKLESCLKIQFVLRSKHPAF